MNRDEAKQLLPIIQAYAEGKEVQYRDFGDWNDYDDDCEPDFTDKPAHYRIKPEPVECWAVVFSDGDISRSYPTECEARKYCNGLRVIRMREVHVES